MFILKFCQINGSSNITIGKRHCHDNSIKNPITLSFPISSKYWKSFASQKPQGNEYKPLLLPLFTLAVLQTPTLKVISHVVKHKYVDRNTRGQTMGSRRYEFRCQHSAVWGYGERG